MLQKEADKNNPAAIDVPKIVIRVQQGDENAFAELFNHFQPIIHRRVWHMVPQRDVDDVTQEVFIAVIKSIKSFRQDSKFSTWLRTITNRQVANFYRRRERKEGNIAEDVDVYSSEFAVADPAPNMRRHEDYIGMRNALAHLPDHYQEVLLLRFAEDLPFNEIAKELDKSLDATKSLFRRALAALQAALG